MPRISKENYYLDIAETVLERATCLRRVYGAIIVKTTRSFPPATTAPPVGGKLRGHGLLHTGGHAGAEGRAL